MSLLDEVLEAYGGIERWKELDSIRVHQIVGGVLWPLKNVDGVINDSTVEIRVQEQRAWHRPFTRQGLRSTPTIRSAVSPEPAPGFAAGQSCSTMMTNSSGFASSGAAWSAEAQRQLHGTRRWRNVYPGPERPAIPSAVGGERPAPWPTVLDMGPQASTQRLARQRRARICLHD
jgi:hypothetical protein